MLAINIEDVLNVLNTVKPYLIGLGVVLILVAVTLIIAGSSLHLPTSVSHLARWMRRPHLPRWAVRWARRLPLPHLHHRR